MAKKSISTRKTLKSVFSRSEANLKESVDNDSGKSSTLKFFKWKKKKKSSTEGPQDNLEFTRTETASLDNAESQDGEESSGQMSSLYGTAPRSKKGPLSYSETDLRKPRSFKLFNLNWKKKKRDVSKGFSSGNENPRVEGHISEKDEYENQGEADQTSPNQMSFEAPPHTISNQSQDVFSDLSLANEEDRLGDNVIAADAFMPLQLDSEIIPYIESSFSDSDGYQTPPESPAIGYRSSNTSPVVNRDYLAPAETNIPGASSTFSNPLYSISEVDGPEPVNVTDNLHTAEVFSSNNAAVEESPETDHASPESCTSEADVIDSVSLIPKGQTAETVDTHPVDNSNLDEHLYPNGVSGKDDYSLFDSDFWKTDLADFDKPLTADNTSKADTKTCTTENSISSFPQHSSSFISGSFMSDSNNIESQLSSTSNSDLVFTHPEPSLSSPKNIITTELKDYLTSTTDDTNVSVTDLVKNTDPYDGMNVTTHTSKPICVRDVLSVTSNCVDVNMDTKAISSFPYSDAEGNSSLVYEDAYTVNCPAIISHLEDSQPDFNSETISMESPQTVHNPTCTVDSEEPYSVVAPVHPEPVLTEDESKLSLTEPVRSGIHTTDSTNPHSFDLSGPSDPITSDHSWRVLTDNTYYSSTLSQNERQDYISKGIDRAKSASFENVSGSSLDFTENGTSRTLISEATHSQELFNSQARKEEIYQRTIQSYKGLNTEEVLYKGSLKNYEMVGQGKTSELSTTTKNEVQMKEPEEKYRSDDVYNETHEVSPIEEKGIYILPQKQMSLNEIVEIQHVQNHEEAEDLTESLQNTRETCKSHGVLALESEVCVDTDVLMDQAERQIHRHAPLKPALPVDRECVPKECDPAPPAAEPVEVWLSDSSMSTHNHLETWLHPRRSSEEKTLLPEDTVRIQYQTRTEILHSEREEQTANGEDRKVTFLTSTQNGEGQGWQTTPDTEKISAAYNTEETFIHSKNTSQGEVGLTEIKTATDSITTFTHGRVVDISETTPEGRTDVEVNAVQEHRLPTQLTQGDRFFHASTVLNTLIEEPDTENEAGTEPGSETDMSTGVAVFNTKLSRPSSPREGRDDVMVVRKVSLVNSDRKISLDNHESQLDSNGFRDSESSPELRRRLQSPHSDSEVKTFTENSDYNLTNSSHSSQLSPTYERGVYTSHFSSSGTQKTQPTSYSLESTSSLGNSSWKFSESEVQSGSAGYYSGRSRVELSTPAGEREGEVRKTGFESQERSLMITEVGEDFSDVFKATRVEVDSSPTDLEPEPLISYTHEMDNLVDTLKSMERPVRQRLPRQASNTPFSSLPPIEEDAPILSPTRALPVTEPKKLSNGDFSLPLDLGFHLNSPKDMRSPMAMLKERQFGDPPRLPQPMRASALSSIVMRKGSLTDLNTEETPATNGESLLPTSRLENSLFFQRENGQRSIFRAASLPDIGNSPDRISSAPKSTDSLVGNGYERFSYLMSSSSSLSGISEKSRMSMPPTFRHNSSTETSSFDPKTSYDLYRSPDLGLQRSSSVDGALHHQHNDYKGFQMNQKPKAEPEPKFTLKYKAFPDSYMFIYDKPGMTGHVIEVRGDVVDATPWEFTGTISIRVVRGGWVLYEKPDFKGEKIALDEEDIELTNPFGPPEEEEAPLENGNAQDQEDEELKPQMKKTFAIGSIRRAVRDYSVPEISFFPEEHAEGKKVTFRDTSEDARIFGFPIKANSVIINAGLWLVFAEPFFQGIPRVLEVGGYSSPAAWGVTNPYVSSVHPLKIGEPRVENISDPKIVLYEKPYFTGKSREIYSCMRDFMTRTDNNQTLYMYSPGSMKVIGGCWVGYEKEGFRGYQYLLEEGEYHDWRVWGGDLSEPGVILYAEPEGQMENEEDQRFEVTEAVADVELFGFGINTHSIHVLSGAWVAYSHVDFSGNQYVLEKGLYAGCGDWGSGDNRICSIQPILPAPSEGPSIQNEILLYSEPSFQGTCSVCNQNMGRLPENLIVRSCRVVGGSWVLYEGDMFTGDQYVLSEGNFPNLTSMGCPPSCSIRSVKSVPMTFSVPSVSLFGLECFEGREVTADTQISSLHEEGFNTQFLSVRVNSGCWVLCEHSNYRGRQILLEPIEITNWLKYSSLSCVGSLYPVRQKQRLFRIKNNESGHYMSVQGGVEDMKTGRVVVSEEVEGFSDVWFYQDGLIKNKLARTMSLQVMGNVETGAKVVLWNENRTPVPNMDRSDLRQNLQCHFPWNGGKSYDKHHLVVREENEEHASQQWNLEFV
ncbi:Beta/gamma crystallin domain-containing protein 2 [Triplophysa tibetana]|uniref:Beta/gamma crystallin domain-containing protein 2 n=1 Tax=Triplophysa tibetana TaxID=1572043 RepID=A0A5A9NMV0_9TELE|nr:Beta/gamma crystallin domain-containing protein 2 [Triplophysa tibetana]